MGVHEKMRSLGMSPLPSTASLARIFRQAGVAQCGAEELPSVTDVLTHELSPMS